MSDSHDKMVRDLINSQMRTQVAVPYRERMFCVRVNCFFLLECFGVSS